MFDKHLAGGMQSWARGLLAGLTKRGLDIQLVCPDSSLHSFPKDIVVHHVLHDSEVDGLAPVDYYKDLNELRKFEEKADIIWTIDRSFPINSKKPKLLTLGTFCYEKEMKSIFQDDYDTVVVVSEYEKKQFDFYKKDIRVVPMFVEEGVYRKLPNDFIINKYFKYDKTKKYILFPHRPEYSKGHYDAIAILDILVKYDKSFILLIPEAPDSRLADVKTEHSYINQLKEYIKNIGLKENVIFHKWVDGNDMGDYLSIGYFALFLTKLPETFGISLINCVSCGVPVVSYGSGALNEIVPNKKGQYIISDKDYVTAANIILRGRNNEEMNAGQNYIKRYQKESVVESYYEILKSLMKKNNK